MLTFYILVMPFDKTWDYQSKDEHCYISKWHIFNELFRFLSLLLALDLVYRNYQAVRVAEMTH